MNWARRRRCGLVGVLLASALAFPASPGVRLVDAQDPPAGQGVAGGFARSRVRPVALGSADFEVRKRQLWQAGKRDEAVARMRQELARSREILGEWDKYSMETLDRLAGLQEAHGDWAAARKTLEEVVAVRERQPDRKDWHVVDARQALADFDRRAAMTPLQRGPVEGGGPASPPRVPIEVAEGL